MRRLIGSRQRTAPCFVIDVAAITVVLHRFATRRQGDFDYPPEQIESASHTESRRAAEAAETVAVPSKAARTMSTAVASDT